MKPNQAASQAGRELAKRSVKARRAKWGEQGFRLRMAEYGKLGGRPNKRADEPARKEK